MSGFKIKVPDASGEQRALPILQMRQDVGAIADAARKWCSVFDSGDFENIGGVSRLLSNHITAFAESATLAAAQGLPK